MFSGDQFDSPYLISALKLNPGIYTEVARYDEIKNIIETIYIIY